MKISDLKNKAQEITRQLSSHTKKFFSKKNNVVYSIGITLLMGVAALSFYVSQGSNLGQNLKGCFPTPFGCLSGPDSPKVANSIPLSCTGTVNPDGLSIQYTATTNDEPLASLPDPFYFTWQFSDGGAANYSGPITKKDLLPGYQPQSITAIPTLNGPNNVSVVGDGCTVNYTRPQKKINYACIATQNKKKLDTNQSFAKTGTPVEFDFTPKDANLSYYPILSKTYGALDVAGFPAEGGIYKDDLTISATDKGCAFGDQNPKCKYSFPLTCSFKLKAPPPAPDSAKCTVSNLNPKAGEPVNIKLENVTLGQYKQRIDWSLPKDSAIYANNSTVSNYKFSSGTYDKITATITRTDFNDPSLISTKIVTCPKITVGDAQIANVNLINPDNLFKNATSMTCSGIVETGTRVNWKATLDGIQPQGSKFIWKSIKPSNVSISSGASTIVMYKSISDLQASGGATAQVQLVDAKNKPLPGFSATCSLPLGEFGQAIPVPADAPKITSCKGEQISKNGDKVQIVWSAVTDKNLLPTDTFKWMIPELKQFVLGQKTAPVTYDYNQGKAKSAVFLIRNGQVIDSMGGSGQKPCETDFIGYVPGDGPEVTDIAVTQNDQIINISYKLSKSSGNATLNAQILDDSLSIVKNWDPMTKQADGTKTLQWDGGDAGKNYTFVISGNDETKKNPIPHATKNFTVKEGTGAKDCSLDNSCPPPKDDSLKPAEDVVTCSVKNDSAILETGKPAVLSCSTIPNTFVSAFVMKGDFDPTDYDTPDKLDSKDIVLDFYPEQKQFVSDGDPNKVDFLLTFDGHDRFDSLIKSGDYTFLVYGRPDNKTEYDISKQKIRVLDKAPEVAPTPGDENSKDGEAKTEPTNPVNKADPNLSKCGTKYPKDIKKHWAEGYIKIAYDQCIVSGYSDQTFKPNNKITRAEAVKIGLKALGITPSYCYDADCGIFDDLTDINLSVWVRKAWEMKAVSGLGNRIFGQNQYITRGHSVAFVAKLAYAVKLIPEPFYKGCYTADCGTGFKDIPITIGAYLKELLNLSPNLVQGKAKGKFDPNTSITRAEFLKILMKLKQYQNI